MAFFPPHLTPIHPGASREEAEQIWEQNRETHNRFAERSNRNWINRITGKWLKPMPPFSEVVASYREQKRQLNRGTHE